MDDPFAGEFQSGCLAHALPVMHKAAHFTGPTSAAIFTTQLHIYGDFDTADRALGRKHRIVTKRWLRGALAASSQVNAHQIYCGTQLD